MRIYRSILALSLFTLSSSMMLGQDTSLTDKQYRSALRDYISEAEDYINTMKVTRSEVRTWRGIYLSERFEGKLSSLEQALVQSNKQIISEVEKAISEGGIDSLDDVLLMRMAQLQFEKESLAMGFKMKNYESQLKSFLTGRIPKAPELPAADYKASVEYCRTLLTKYPRSPLSDKAHYLMAYALDEMGQFDAAIEIYKRFIRRHPYSSLIDEIKWRVAEHYFDTRDLNKAAFFYSELSKNEKSSYQLKALYKLGAAFFAGKRYEVAANYFTELYNKTSASVDDNRENETLLDESLEYLGIIQSFGVKLKLDADTQSEATNRLAQAYKRLPNEKKARDVYLDFMKREPYSPRLPPYSNEVIQSYLSEALVEGADGTRDRLVGFLTRDDSWWKRNFKNRKATFEGEDLLEEYLLSSAESHAQKGFDRKDKQELKIARDQFQRFLRSYPYSSLFTRAKFELAQVEYFAELYDASKESFEFVMNDTSSSIYTDDAAYGYLWSVIKKISYQMDKESNLVARRGKDGELSPIQDLSEQDKLFLSAAQVYILKSTTSSRKQTVLYKTAEIHFKNNNFDLAQKALDMILDDHASVTLITAKALRLSAEIANIRGDWTAVSERNAELLSLSFSTDIKGLGEIQLATAGTQALDTASKMETAGKKLEAAKEYERIALGLPRAKFTPYATYRASSLYRDEGLYKESIENTERLKGTEYEPEGLFIKASNLKSLMSFQESAEKFEDFAKANPRHTWTSDALFSAASVRRDLKQYKEAAQLFVKYHDMKRVDVVLFEAMELYAKSGDIKSIQELSGRIAKSDRDGLIRSKVIMADAYWRKGDVKTVVNLCREVGTLTKSEKGLSAHAVRSRAICRYYSLSYQLKTPGNISKVEEQAKQLEQSKQNDLLAKIYTDIGEQLIAEGKNQDGVEKLRVAWSYVGRMPYSEEGKKIYSLLMKNDKSYPAGPAIVANWKLAEGDYFNWMSPSTQQMAWGSARSLCEREFFNDCLKEIDQILKSEPSEEMMQNKLVALLKAGQDSSAKEVLREMGKRSDWNQPTIRLAILSGEVDLVPTDKLNVEIPVQSQRYEALVARAELSLRGQKYKTALLDLQDAIRESSDRPLPYVVLARLFHETGHYELMRTVLLEGVKNTKSRSGLYGLSLYWNSVLGSTRAFKAPDTTDQLDSRALYGYGLASLMNGDKKSYTAVESLLSDKPIWSKQFKAAAATLNQEKVGPSSDGIVNAQLGLLESISNEGSDKSERYNSAVQNGLIPIQFIKDYREKAAP